MNTELAPMPSLDGLSKLLAEWINSTAYIIELTDEQGRPLGNNGDQLMHAVFYKILANFGIKLSDQPAEADVLIVPPNGAMLEVYNFPGILQRRLTSLPDKPLVIFPSSAFFPEKDPSAIFGERSAKTLWILRERNSFNHLSEKWGDRLACKGVSIALDHDVVASGHRYVREIVGTHPAKRPLVAARLDRESRSISSSGNAPLKDSTSRTLQKKLAAFLPYGRLYTRLARLAKRGELLSAGRRLTDGVDHEGVPVVGSSRADYVDISSPEYATFEEYLQYMARASVVVTDRLHVGLPSAILGKNVILVEAGYHKLGGVYEQSLREMPNVAFLKKK